MGAQAPLSWDQNGAPHHFKAVLMNCFADRLPYLVLCFLILYLRDRERGSANRRNPPECLHMTQHRLTNPRLGTLSPWFGGRNGETMTSLCPSFLPRPPPALGVVRLFVRPPLGPALSPTLKTTLCLGLFFTDGLMLGL